MTNNAFQKDECLYLGDSVYVSFDGYGVVLKTESHEHPTNVIYLEPLVIERLVMYLKPWLGAENND